MRWGDLWEALRVEGEMNAGSEETERVWRARWATAATVLQTLGIIHLEAPSREQSRTATSTSPPSPIATPVPSIPHLTVSSRWYRAPALYTCRVVHECDPPEYVEYYGLPFFKLFLGDIYDILKEVGDPSQRNSLQKDLPVIVESGPECLLLVRNMHGELGWLLASFMYPVD